MKPAAFGKRGFEGKRSNAPAFGRGGGSSAPKTKPKSAPAEAKKVVVEDKPPPPQPPKKPSENGASEDVDHIAEIVEEKLLKVLPPGLSGGRAKDEINAESTTLIKKVCEDEKVEFSEAAFLDRQT